MGNLEKPVDCMSLHDGRKLHVVGHKHGEGPSQSPGGTLDPSCCEATVQPCIKTIWHNDMNQLGTSLV